jgi:hypothetical protein
VSSGADPFIPDSSGPSGQAEGTTSHHAAMFALNPEGLPYLHNLFMSGLFPFSKPDYSGKPTYSRIPMGNPQRNLWQVFVDECRQCLADYFSPFILLARWLRRRTRK